MCRSYSLLSSHAWYDMKKTVKKLMCFALSFFMFSLCGCGGEEKISEVSPEKTGYIAAEPDTSREEKIKEVLQSYLTALEHHSISELAACSSDELPLYNDQTAFDDITDELESARLDKIYLDGIRLKGDKVQAAAEYTLMGKDCEREGMPDAAIANYKKALYLYPDAPEPKRRLKKLEGKK